MAFRFAFTSASHIALPPSGREFRSFFDPIHQLFVDFLRTSHHHMVGPAVWVRLRSHIDSGRLFPISQPEGDGHPDLWPLCCFSAGIEGHKGKAPLIGKRYLGFGNLDLYIRNLSKDLLLQFFIHGQGIHVLPKEEKNITVHVSAPLFPIISQHIANEKHLW